MAAHRRDDDHDLLERAGMRVPSDSYTDPTFVATIFSSAKDRGVFCKCGNVGYAFCSNLGCISGAATSSKKKSLPSFPDFRLFRNGPNMCSAAVCFECSPPPPTLRMIIGGGGGSSSSDPNHHRRHHHPPQALCPDCRISKGYHPVRGLSYSDLLLGIRISSAERCTAAFDHLSGFWPMIFSESNMQFLAKWLDEKDARFAGSIVGVSFSNVDELKRHLSTMIYSVIVFRGSSLLSSKIGEDLYVRVCGALKVDEKFELSSIRGWDLVHRVDEFFDETHTWAASMVLADIMMAEESLRRGGGGSSALGGVMMMRATREEAAARKGEARNGRGGGGTPQKKKNIKDNNATTSGGADVPTNGGGSKSLGKVTRNMAKGSMTVTTTTTTTVKTTVTSVSQSPPPGKERAKKKKKGSGGGEGGGTKESNKKKRAVSGGGSSSSSSPPPLVPRRSGPGNKMRVYPGWDQALTSGKKRTAAMIPARGARDNNPGLFGDDTSSSDGGSVGDAVVVGGGGYHSLGDDTSDDCEEKPVVKVPAGKGLRSIFMMEESRGSSSDDDDGSRVDHCLDFFEETLNGGNYSDGDGEAAGHNPRLQDNSSPDFF